MFLLPGNVNSELKNKSFRGERLSIFNLTYLECDLLGRLKFALHVTKTLVMITRHSFQAVL
jgi:hypothetical protein